MSLSIQKMANYFVGDAQSNEQLMLMEQKYRISDMFFEIMNDWTDLTHAKDYSVEDYREVLNKIMILAELGICTGNQNVVSIGVSLTKAKGICTGKRVL